MKTLFMVQHTESEHHINGHIGAGYDWPLTARGREQAFRIGEWLKKAAGDGQYKMYVSPLLRALQTAEEIKALLSEVSRCRDTIRQYEVEISRIVKETDANDKLSRSVRLEAANAKKTFDQLKSDYEEESKSKKGELEAQRAKAKELMDQVDPKLLEEYETIKKHISPPVARLTHGQCSGCNTSLPSAILSRIKGGTLVECETCGRMIIQ